ARYRIMVRQSPTGGISNAATEGSLSDDADAILTHLVPLVYLSAPISEMAASMLAIAAIEICNETGLDTPLALSHVAEWRSR
ncbi:MAG: hypothetical protein AAF590_04855, partial [Pseudomonadota bacterium]